ncbi:MAG TPA: delta-60 repeat domain-containing protein [Solirubrobacterales bacterium]|nr:delta-60 repeat domain-containing protein [Solirubrobacterales bacterium]
MRNSVKQHHLACLVAGLVAALLASAVAVSADQRVRPVRIKTQVGAEEQVVAYGRSRILLVPHEGPGVRRIRLDGSLDRSFGEDGTALIASEDAVVAPDGKVLVATTSCPRCGRGPKSEARITRLLPNGKRDPSFGHGGSVDVPFGRRYNYAQAVALAADGDILLGGIRVNYQVNRGESSFTLAVARLRADGSLDRSFGGDGVSVLPGGAEIGVFDIAPTPSGGVVVDAGDTIGTFLWKLRRDGSTDRSFGRAGIVEAPGARDVDRVLDEEQFYVPGIAVLPSGRLLLAATGFGFRGNRVGAIRLLADGRPDRSYGNDGWTVLAAGRTQANGLALLGGGALAVATSFEGPKERSSFGLIAFGPRGHPDRRYGEGGRCRAGLDSGSYGAVDVAVVGGRPVVVGHGDADSRLLSCPALPRR